ncbi:Hsp20/alpha crystallin family protein [Pikeienuella sp. HZG-20]|uniref:Hsp20/alpha crystallin family protein n=1 Tax=Paludibacillus litoralis TaxID=3133267 RepID=UPI0030EE3423
MAQELKKSDGDAVQSGTRDAGPILRPATDIFEKDDKITLAIDMPGVKPDTVDVSVYKRSLTVRGEIDAAAPEGCWRIYGEYPPGVFERAFSLPEAIDADSIEASHRDGVLTLVLKKSEAAKPKQIKVKAA